MLKAVRWIMAGSSPHISNFGSLLPPSWPSSIFGSMAHGTCVYLTAALRCILEKGMLSPPLSLQTPNCYCGKESTGYLYFAVPASLQIEACY